MASSMDVLGATLHHHLSKPSNLASLAGSLLIAYLGTIGFYRAFLHPYSRIPGPFLARFGHFWLTYQYLSGQWHDKSAEIHRTYGPVVRIAANEVSFVDVEGLNTMYGLGKKSTKKTPWYSIWRFSPPSHRGIFDDDDHHTHAVSRKRVAGAYSMSSILSLEDTIQDSWHQLEEVLDEHADSGEVVDMSHWTNMFAFETVSCMGGFDLDFIKTRKDTFDIQHSLKDVFWAASNAGYYPLLMPILMISVALYNKAMGYPSGDGIVVFGGYMAKTVAERQTKLDPDHPPERLDLVDWSLVQKDAKGRPFKFDFLLSDASNLLGAGADTTSIGIRAVMIPLVQDKRLRERLVKEIEEYCQRMNVGPDQHLAYRDCSDMPLLLAIVKEATRLHPSIVWQLPRIVPEGGVSIAGHYLAPGYTASASPWSSNRNAAVFDDPDQFLPDRWLDSDADKVKRMDNALFTFGRGSRVCVGRHLAQLEMCCFAANLLRRYTVLDKPSPSPIKVTSYWFAPQEGFFAYLARR